MFVVSCGPTHVWPPAATVPPGRDVWHDVLTSMRFTAAVNSGPCAADTSRSRPAGTLMPLPSCDSQRWWLLAEGALYTVDKLGRSIVPALTRPTLLYRISPVCCGCWSCYWTLWRDYLRFMSACPAWPLPSPLFYPTFHLRIVQIENDQKAVYNFLLVIHTYIHTYIFICSKMK